MREHSSSKRRSGIDNVVYFRTTEGFAMGFDDEIASAEIYRSDGKARYDPLLLGALRDELNPCREAPRGGIASASNSASAQYCLFVSPR